MLCEICNKNEATIHIQEIVGGKKKSMHLCSSCAAARQKESGIDFGPFDLAGLLYKLSGNQPAEQNENTPENKTELVCPQCSWRESQLNSSGRLGCENCYKVFSSLLNDALKKMHHGSSHVGKQPSGKGTELGAWHCELARLQKRLQQAIAEENYEEAAILRDKVNDLKARCEKLSRQTESGNE